MTQFEQALVEVAADLDRRGLAYMLVGGMAVGLWGEPRTTLDLDFTIWRLPFYPTSTK